MNNETKITDSDELNVRTKIKQTLKDFSDKDIILLKISANERAATHRIACLLQNYFPDWDVDCEYNRKEAAKKRLSGDLVLPDIIVHKRGTTKNLLCIEAKKAENSQESQDKDKMRLCNFTDPKGEYGYRFGVLMILSLKYPYKIDCQWFRNGHAV